MASQSGSVWAIDLGNNSLKALRLSTEGGSLEVIGFDYIEHGKVLSSGSVRDAEREELTAISLRQFVRQNDLGKDEVIVSVPSQNSFARFVNLPPVEKKRVPEIVKFEAAQQIPFDIDDVQWDWQLMSDGDSAEKKVGIFAIKNEVVTSALDYFTRENVAVRYVQMAPMALYNYAFHDRAELVKSEHQATVIVDIGATNTDLVVCSGSTVWQRCIPMGGNAFTRAIADTFKLNFDKAEKLKRTAAMSKYARQIFQAMRPVFSDLAAEIQRSLGFYTSSNTNVKLVGMIAFGGGTQMRGLLKYLQQSVQLPIERPDSFKKLVIGSDVSAAKFHDNVANFGIVYGLGLQALGEGRIESNLLPRSIARSMAWAGKAKHFMVAAGILLVVSALSFGRVLLDKFSYGNKDRIRSDIRRIIDDADEAKRNLAKEQEAGKKYEAAIDKEFELFKYRELIPYLHQVIFSVLPDHDPHADAEQQELYRAFEKGDVHSVMQIPRKQRKQLFITSMSVRFTQDLGSAQFEDEGFIRRRRSNRTEEDSGDTLNLRDRLLGGAGRGPGRGGPRMPGRGGAMGAVDSTELKEPGFVITIAGYSPYENVGELLEPVGVEDDRGRWGVVTRLMHLDKVMGGKVAFELYKKDELDNFKWEDGAVELNDEAHGGIGVKRVRKSEDGGADEEYLVDPMTEEVISKVALEQDGGNVRVGKGSGRYEENDHWFVLNFKLLWKESPHPQGAEAVGSASGGRGLGRGRAPGATRSPAPGRRRVPGRGAGAVRGPTRRTNRLRGIDE